MSAAAIEVLVNNAGVLHQGLFALGSRALAMTNSCWRSTSTA